MSQLHKSMTEMYRKFKIPYGDQGLSQVLVLQLYKDFLEGQETVEDEVCTGRPVMATTSEDLIKSD